MSTPLLTVVVATRNRPDLLEQALQSIKRQTFYDYEACVVDDGSSRETLERYDRIWQNLDDRFRLQLPAGPDAPGTGPSGGRNRGIQMARGRFLAFLDDDDEWIVPNHLEVGVKALQTTGADFFFADMVGHREGQTIWSTWYPDCPELVRGDVVCHTPCVHRVSLKSFMRVARHHLAHPNTYVVRTELVRRAGGFIRQLFYAEDFNLMIRIGDAASGILFRPEPVARYRFPTGNSSSLTNTAIEQNLQSVLAAQHARSVGRQKFTRRCARTREAWALRELADEVGKVVPGEGVRLRCQAFTVFPTAGAAWSVLKSACTAAGSLIGGRLALSPLPRMGAIDPRLE